MDDWEIMYGTIQEIARSAVSFGDGVRRAINVARAYPRVFDEFDFWDRVEAEWSRRSQEIMIGWARDGLDKMDLGEGWTYLHIELGDCPDTFNLFQPGDQKELSELRLRELLFSEALVGFYDLMEEARSWGSGSADPLSSQEGRILVDHHIRELADDELLNWSEQNTGGYGNNGYFLWLTFGVLAMLEPLRKPVYCRRVLGQCDRLYLLCGFEGLGTYLATVTPEGLLFESNASPRPLSEQERLQITMQFD